MKKEEKNRRSLSEMARRLDSSGKTLMCVVLCCVVFIIFVIFLGREGCARGVVLRVAGSISYILSWGKTYLRSVGMFSPMIL